MAIPIREIPVLTGQSAVEFMIETEKYDSAPVPTLSEERERELRVLDEAYKKFVW